MATQMYVNLPVKDVQRAKDFFAHLGFRFEPKYSDANALCMIVAEDSNYVMLLAESFFQGFTKKAISDAATTAEVLICLSCDDREHVESLVAKAIAAGGTTPMEPKDHGFMYQHGFQDLDGHQWELMYMDPNAACPG